MNTDSQKKFPRGKATAFAVAMGLLVGCFLIALQVEGGFMIAGASPAIKSSSNSTAFMTATTVIHPDVSSSVSGYPARLIIPALGIQANIQEIGMSHNGLNIGIPSNFTDVGWYRYGSIPGMPGIAIIDGHLDGKYVQKAVFYNLGNLQPGDLVEVVDASDTILKFQVIGSEIYDYTASTTDLFSNETSTTNLDLITCAGDWLPSQDSYDKRIVVFTQLIKS